MILLNFTPLIKHKTERISVGWMVKAQWIPAILTSELWQGGRVELWIEWWYLDIFGILFQSWP